MMLRQTGQTQTDHGWQTEWDAQFQV